MSNPAGNFIDSNTIVIRNNIPYYYVTGTSYLDRLKNGISLDYMFEL